MILDKLNTESSVANRAMMADYLDAKRFVWVFFVDSFYLSVRQQRAIAIGIRTRKSIFRCRKRCCTAGCSRKGYRNYPVT